MKKKKTNQNVHKTSILSNFTKIGKELFILDMLYSM